ncbi:FAD-binding oxidoreductase [Streptomyces sp. NBC_00654]|uniref:FAD-binding oxidoreductase n=1 Tax=Streptomyces sp. NBC_00654 TaxID=2975799 RepID=UPI0022561D0B|nr:FAD-binding oxidoreductase [Streptomyces sp. NBC_00654]MCX4968504.1 FAD-binding oxidoreductase [Streptomyces sp. NBC_00654]
MTPRSSGDGPGGLSGLSGLRKDLTGDAFAPGDAGYDEARTVFNSMIDRRPAVVAQCVSPADVARALRFARDNGLEIAVRGGGHSVAGMSVSDGGLVVDLRRMHDVTVAPRAASAQVGGGATMSDLDRATQPYALATTGGRVSTTGVGGFTLSGGSGWLERKFGLACDSLLAAELVTADGESVRASAEENPDLFWALHGGGGNFGVATSLTLRLHPLPAMSIVFLLFRPDDGPAVLTAYRDLMESAPDEAGGACMYLTGPPEDFVPAHLVGQLTFAALLTWAGPEAEARAAAAPLLALPHEAEIVTGIPYADLQCMLDDPPGMRNYWSAEYLDAFPDAAVDTFCAAAGAMPVPSGSQHVLFPMGGAVARGPADHPLPWRAAPWAVHPFGVWESPDDDERGREWVHRVRDDFRSWASGAVYLNFIGHEGQARVVAGVGTDNYARLAAVKARYDPDNVFRLNHNIEPAAAGA